jgi:hypothetical protein
MTLNEAIEYYTKVATDRELADEEKGDHDKWNETIFMTKKQSVQIIADNRQLVEWLMEYKDLKAEQNDQYVFIHELISELKEAKRLLKSAVDEWNLVCEWGNCGEYCSWYVNGKCSQEWSNKAEALKLIGDEPNV